MSKKKHPANRYERLQLKKIDVKKKVKKLEKQQEAAVVPTSSFRELVEKMQEKEDDKPPDDIPFVSPAMGYVWAWNNCIVPSWYVPQWERPEELNEEINDLKKE